MIEPISAEKYQELLSKHGDLYEAKTPQGTIIFRHPRRAEVEALHVKAKAAHKDAGPMQLYIQDEIALMLAVYPEKPILTALFDKYPLLSGNVYVAISNVAEGDETARAKAPSASSSE